jgi:hypothetical protein
MTTFFFRFLRQAFDLFCLEVHFATSQGDGIPSAQANVTE